MVNTTGSPSALSTDGHSGPQDMEGSTSAHQSGTPEVRITPTPHRTIGGGRGLQNENANEAASYSCNTKAQCPGSDSCAQGMARKRKPAVPPHRAHDLPEGELNTAMGLHFRTSWRENRGADVSPKRSRRGFRARNNEIPQHIYENG